jgi:hypothetical protein
MNANAAFGLQDVQIHVVDRHGIFVPHRRTLLPAGIEHPGLDIASQLPAAAESEVVREYVAEMQEAEAAVQGFADPHLQKIVPSAIRSSVAAGSENCGLPQPLSWAREHPSAPI